MKQKDLLKYSKKFSRILSQQQISRLFERLNRISNKIAPLSADTGNTQTINRWELEKTNPHFASEEQCNDIYLALLEDLAAFLKTTSSKPRYLLPLFAGVGITPKNLLAILNTSSRIGSLELPIWYKTDPIKGGKHQKDNIFWFSPYEDLETIRKLVANKMIVTKIQVKAYLTDRRQTGDYQTNREIRWEAHSNSPQYASRIDCMQIEAKLLAQIFSFVGAPDILETDKKIIERALESKFVKDGFRCPISGKPIFYNEFHEKVASPTHGRSGFQVGHLDPLASTGKHIAPNTSWITDLGNRVQGESSLEEITNDIFFMTLFHKERLKLSWNQVEAIAKKKES